MYHYINGEFFPATEAKILINDLSILRGYGVFDYLRTYHRRPFLLDQYLERFFNSAAISGLPVPASPEEIKKVIEKLITLCPFEECGIRLVLTGGYSTDNFTPEKPNFFILTENFKSPSKESYLSGVKLISYQYQRNFPEAKFLYYAPAVIYNQIHADKKAAEILYYDHGKITEASRSNFFVIQGNRLITAGKGILKGITRNTILTVAEKDFIIEEENFPIKDLTSVDEAFISSTTKDILPVVKVDDLIIGDGTVGKQTIKLMEKYKIYRDRISLF